MTKSIQKINSEDIQSVERSQYVVILELDNGRIHAEPFTTSTMNYTEANMYAHEMLLNREHVDTISIAVLEKGKHRTFVTYKKDDSDEKRTRVAVDFS